MVGLEYFPAEHRIPYVGKGSDGQLLIDTIAICLHVWLDKCDWNNVHNLATYQWSQHLILLT